MSTSERDFLHAAINAKLASLLDQLSAKPSWCGRWQRLSPESSDQERLTVYQAIRDSGVLPADAGFYLVAWQLDALAEHGVETALRGLDDRLSTIMRKHGLKDDEIWEPGEAPPEYEAVLRQYNDAWDALLAAELERHGEHALAALFRTDRAEYERRSEAGRQFFHGHYRLNESDEPEWLDSLLEAVGASLEPESPMGPSALRFRQEEDFWEVDVYSTPVELVGGADDGALVSAPFSLDFEQLRAAFARIDSTGWNAHGWYNDDGPFVWVEGSFQGHDVFLRVLAQAPEGEDPGAKLRVTRKSPG